jgi:hypothetical protein
LVVAFRLGSDKTQFWLEELRVFGFPVAFVLVFWWML